MTYNTNTRSSRESYSRSAPRRNFRDQRDGGRSRFGSSSRPAHSSHSPKPFNPKRSFKKDFIDEKLFINKAVVEKEGEAYEAKHEFKDFIKNEIFLRNIVFKKYSSPSPIQDQAIPVVAKGGDVIGIASTGTGKTAAFLIPIINKLIANKNKKAMILAPTRELAQQIELEFRSFTRGLGLYTVATVGGAPIFRQIHELKKGIHIVIGTPGRVKDLFERGKINMQEFDTIVLDEADRMLDMGFIGDMRQILGAMPKEKQGLFFSATFSSDIKKLCGEFLRDPVHITIKARDTSSSVDQNIVRAKGREGRIEALQSILGGDDAKKVIIFRETKRSVDQLAEDLTDRGFKVSGLHGDMRNRERERAVSDLATGRIQVLIATDVAARGIDIADISLVINYDLPNNYETYIHRIGRTGRGNKKGKSLTFV